MSGKYKCQFSVLAIGILLSGCSADHSKNKAQDKVNEVIENYGTGETSRTFTRINGKIEGLMTDYYPSGALKGERYFKDNKQVGKTVIYFESGAIKEVQYYENGLRNGGDTIFFESGLIQYISEFKDEKKNGYLKIFDITGNMTYEAKFAMDTLIEVGGKSVRNQKISQ
jgi:antitoxin component YwqK of YwqJK toxin-antitoxin module